jgi:DNA-binding NtrC family response regulator
MFTVVEDDPVYLYAVEQALKNTGHRITYHTSSYSAWDAVAAGVPMDMLLTDLWFRHGEPNGLALAFHARSKNPDIAILLMTSDDDLLDQMEKDLGAVFSKSKPLDGLGAAVQERLNRRGTSKAPEANSILANGLSLYASFRA